MFYNELWLIMIMEKSIMDFKNMGDKAILEELGERVMRQRLNRDITQADLAENAGISRGALQRIERGDEFQMGGLIRILRALDLLDQLDLFLPDPGISPRQLARLRSGERQRASGSRKSGDPDLNGGM